MKKNRSYILLLTSLFCSPSCATDINENDFTSLPKSRSSNTHIKQARATKPGGYRRDDEIRIKYIEAKEIGRFKGGTLYGFIDPSFNDSRWQRALDKGFAKTTKGSNGVKFLNKSVLELKINDDARLYTTEVHKNHQGDYIVIFDRSDGHKKINKITNKNNLKIHTDWHVD